MVVEVLEKIKEKLYNLYSFSFIIQLKEEAFIKIAFEVGLQSTLCVFKESLSIC